MVDYDLLNRQLEALVEGRGDMPVAQLANAAALLKETSGWFWVGFYIVDGSRLVLGPFQGSPACYAIEKGKGVCGASWLEARAVRVPDVEKFPGHIACSALSRSEIVVPVMAGGEVVAVLDIDSDRLDEFTEADEEGLARFCRVLERHVDFAGIGNTGCR